MEGHAGLTRDGAVHCVAFDRPDKKNALNRAMYVAATEALRQADGDRSIGAMVLAGSGGVFTAGNDIGDFLEASVEPGEFPAFTFIKTLAACETPLVAAIEGMAIGIGATMMLHCDLVYVAAAWVIVAPLKYSPPLDHVVTLYDRLQQFFIDHALLPAFADPSPSYRK